jgi:ketosteroid isomerase-like protein
VFTNFGDNQLSVDQNKATAREFFSRFSESDIPGAMATLTDDATWWIPGKPELTPIAGLYQKDAITKLFYAMLRRLKHGLRMTPQSMIGEGDRVAVEVTSEGDVTNGRFYRQQYHMLMEFRDGKISAVREYADTHHSHAVWIVPDQPAE